METIDTKPVAWSLYRMQQNNELDFQFSYFFKAMERSLSVLIDYYIIGFIY